MIRHIKALALFLGISVVVLIVGTILGFLMWIFYVTYWSIVWVRCCFHKDWIRFYKTWKDKVLESVF